MLAEDGFNLVLIARNPGPLEEAAQRCRAVGVQVPTLSVDLLDPESVSLIAATTADVEIGFVIYNGRREYLQRAAPGSSAQQLPKGDRSQRDPHDGTCPTLRSGHGDVLGA
jgi:NAD(P)-dependent dehydrogenase (short-subunit alcohol dehydrogenase family)